MAKSLVSHNTLITTSRNLQENPSRRFQRPTSFSFNPIPHLAVQKHSQGRIDFNFLMIKPPRDLLSVYASVPPAGVPPPPSPSGPPPSSWKNWVIGILMTMILPFFTTKGGPLKLITQKVDHMVETAEQIVEAVESVAEKVDKLAEDIEKDLPGGGEGGKLKAALDFIENVAEKVEKDAHVAGDFIDKVEEMEEKVESIIVPVLDQAKEVEKEVNARQAKKPSKL